MLEVVNFRPDLGQVDVLRRPVADDLDEFQHALAEHGMQQPLAGGQQI
jgi:hypothetical protein